ncbi:hypothetical protein OPV22_012612 [Ensete ventricosum]|uniref:Uncharacterized protein n=1 Tax=Ensete ventricosum TaxID=4639 RepID=A0AAV8R7Y7_ENSVE|nr:hypothetical protein OPV22_012612 [Ensete ventricosum]
MPVMTSFLIDSVHILVCTEEFICPLKPPSEALCSLMPIDKPTTASRYFTGFILGTEISIIWLSLFSCGTKYEANKANYYLGLEIGICSYLSGASYPSPSPRFTVAACSFLLQNLFKSNADAGTKEPCISSHDTCSYFRRQSEQQKLSALDAVLLQLASLLFQI